MSAIASRPAHRLARITRKANTPLSSLGGISHLGRFLVIVRVESVQCFGCHAYSAVLGGAGGGGTCPSLVKCTEHVPVPASSCHMRRSDARAQWSCVATVLLCRIATCSTALRRHSVRARQWGAHSLRCAGDRTAVSGRPCRRNHRFTATQHEILQCSTPCHAAGRGLAIATVGTLRYDCLHPRNAAKSAPGWQAQQRVKADGPLLLCAVPCRP